VARNPRIVRQVYFLPFFPQGLLSFLPYCCVVDPWAFTNRTSSSAILLCPLCVPDGFSKYLICKNCFCKSFFLTKNITHVNHSYMKQMHKNRPSDLLFPFTDAHEAYVHLRRTHDAVHRHVSKKLMKWGLSVPKYGVLVRVYDHKELPISDLSNQIFRGNSNMTTLINRMEKDGLVRRFDGNRDRRFKMIRLTPKGLRLAPLVIKEYRAFQQEMMDCLSSNERQDLIVLLKKFKESL
jgi:DNA-binding MarR family transcriptional regulator